MKTIEKVEILRFIPIVLTIFIICTAGILSIEENYAATYDNKNQVLKLINHERSKYDMSELTIDPELSTAASIRAEEISVYMSHTRPDGRKWSTVSSKANGENLGAGQKTPEEVVKSWMASPGHRSNILNPNFKTVGVGYLTNTGQYKNYWTLTFGGLTPKKIVLKEISGLKASSNKNQVTLTWNYQTSSQSNGYGVFSYNKKTKKYNLIKTVSTIHNINKITGLKSNTNYKFKIASYKTVNNKNYYTPGVLINIKTK